MKTVIAVPSLRDFYFTPSRASALGSVSLQKILSRYAIDAHIYNFPAANVKSRSRPLPDELKYLEPLIIKNETGPVSFFTGYRRFGPEPESCASELTATEADVIFISCFAWAYAEDCIELASEIKKFKPNILTVAGGAGVTVNPEYFRLSGVIDLTLPGRAEEVLADVLEDHFGLKPSTGTLQSLQSDPGFIWAETGISIKKNKRFISAMLTRGCPRNCRFCANHLVHGREFRKAGLDDLKSGINELPAELNLHINFEDDNLLIDKNYLFSVIEIIKTRFPYSTFSAENGLDYTLLDKNTVMELIKSGFSSFNLSMASSSRELLRMENRHSDNSRLRSVIETVADTGIPSVTYFICGLENDTSSSVLDNILILHGLPTLTGISMFYPVPGLPGFPPETMSRYPPRLCAGSSAYPWNDSLSTVELITAFRLSRLSNLIKTRQRRILPGENRKAETEEINRLIERTVKSGRLHTIAGGEIIPVPQQDETLVAGFLAAASID